MLPITIYAFQGLYLLVFGESGLAFAFVGNVQVLARGRTDCRLLIVGL